MTGLLRDDLIHFVKDHERIHQFVFAHFVVFILAHQPDASDLRVVQFILQSGRVVVDTEVLTVECAVQPAIRVDNDDLTCRILREQVLYQQCSHGSLAKVAWQLRQNEQGLLYELTLLLDL